MALAKSESSDFLKSFTLLYWEGEYPLEAFR